MFIVGYLYMALAVPLLYLIARMLIKRVGNRGFEAPMYMFMVGLLLVPALVGIPLAIVAYVGIIIKMANNAGIERL